MRRFHRAALATGLVLASSGALAEDVLTGWYLGAGAGAANYADDIPHQIAGAYAGNKTFDLLSAKVVDDADTAKQVFVGYRFIPWLAAEIGYQDFGRARTFYSLRSHQPVLDPVPLLLAGEYRVRDFNAALIAFWPVNPAFDLFARGAFAQTRFDYDEHGNDAGGNPYSFTARTSTRWSKQAGIGAEWRFAAHLALRLDLDRTFAVGRTFALNAESNGRFDHIDAYTLNLQWNL